MDLWHERWDDFIITKRSFDFLSRIKNPRSKRWQNPSSAQELRTANYRTLKNLLFHTKHNSFHHANNNLFKTGNILRLKRSDGAKKTGNIVDIRKRVTFSKKSLIYWFYWDHLGWKMVTPVTLHVLITNHSSHLSSKLQPIALKSSGSTWSTQKSLFSTST